MNRRTSLKALLAALLARLGLGHSSSKAAEPRPAGKLPISRMPDKAVRREYVRPGGKRVAIVRFDQLDHVPPATKFLAEYTHANGKRWAKIHHPSLSGVPEAAVAPTVDASLRQVSGKAVYPS